MSKIEVDWLYKSCKSCRFAKNVIATAKKEIKPFRGDYTKAIIKVECQPYEKGRPRIYYSIEVNKNDSRILTQVGGGGDVTCPRSPSSSKHPEPS